MSTFYVIPKDEDLQHYGILGMKWGVRRYQNADGSLTSEGRKHYNISERKEPENANKLKEKIVVKKNDTVKKLVIAGSIAAAAAAVAIGGMYVYKKKELEDDDHPINRYIFGKTINIDDLSDQSKTIGKDTVIQRISTKSVEDYADQGRIFVTHLKKDNVLYKHYMPKYIDYWHSKGIVDSNTPYVHNIKLNKNINIASDKDVAKAYMKVNNVDHLDHYSYNHFLDDTILDKNNPIAKNFFNELSNMGYDGMIDNNDKQWSKEPLILFKPNDVVESSDSHKLSSFERFINVLKY